MQLRYFDSSLTFSLIILVTILVSSTSLNLLHLSVQRSGEGVFDKAKIINQFLIVTQRAIIKGTKYVELYNV